ncbi:unnamed protein product, partial [Prorocentrum cordatum]
MPPSRSQFCRGNPISDADMDNDEYSYHFGLIPTDEEVEAHVQRAIRRSRELPEDAERQSLLARSPLPTLLDAQLLTGHLMVRPHLLHLFHQWILRHPRVELRLKIGPHLLIMNRNQNHHFLPLSLGTLGMRWVPTLLPLGVRCWAPLLLALGMRILTSLKASSYDIHEAIGSLGFHADGPRGSAALTSTQRGAVIDHLDANRPHSDYHRELHFFALLMLVMMRGEWPALMKGMALAQGVDPRPAPVTASALASAFAGASAHHDEISEQQIGCAKRALDILYPVISADKTEMIRWTMSCHLTRNGSFSLQPGVQELLDDGPVFLEPPADKDATLRDMEEEDAPAFGSRVLADASLQSGVLLLPAKGLAGASVAGEGAFPGRAPYDPVAHVAFGDADDAPPLSAAFPDHDPVDSSCFEQFDNAADSSVGLLADASGSLDHFNLAAERLGTGAPAASMGGDGPSGGLGSCRLCRPGAGATLRHAVREVGWALLGSGSAAEDVADRRASVWALPDAERGLVSHEGSVLVTHRADVRDRAHARRLATWPEAAAQHMLPLPYVAQRRVMSQDVRGALGSSFGFDKLVAQRAEWWLPVAEPRAGPAIVGLEAVKRPLRRSAAQPAFPCTVVMHSYGLWSRGFLVGLSLAAGSLGTEGRSGQELLQLATEVQQPGRAADTHDQPGDALAASHGPPGLEVPDTELSVANGSNRDASWLQGPGGFPNPWLCPTDAMSGGSRHQQQLQQQGQQHAEQARQSQEHQQMDEQLKEELRQHQEQQHQLMNQQQQLQRRTSQLQQLLGMQRPDPHSVEEMTLRHQQQQLQALSHQQSHHSRQQRQHLQHELQESSFSSQASPCSSAAPRLRGMPMKIPSSASCRDEMACHDELAEHMANGALEQMTEGDEQFEQDEDHANEFGECRWHKSAET